MRRHDGPDFDVFYFSEPSTKSSIGVYTGYHPSLHSSKAGITGVVRQPGWVGEAPVEWLRWQKDEQRWSEALVHHFFGKRTSREHADVILHIFVGAPSTHDVARMEKAVATLRLKKAK